jgi:hypothetical protein
MLFFSGKNLQKPILNFTPRGNLWPPRAKLSPRSELCSLKGWSYPLGVAFSVATPFF